jgi:3-oxoacyl-[acyl-carrier protein] reductase
VELYGSVDILVNNAGILSTTDIAHLTEEEWDRTLDINLKSAVFSTQAALKHMIPGGWGRIINISSMAGRMGGISTSCAYTASKAALIGVTMNIARKVAGYGITVNAVAPGTADTEMAQGFSEQERQNLERASLVGKLVDPDSIGETVAFLASDAAAFITGAVIDINGGMFMG